jgi:hypothetical protein
MISIVRNYTSTKSPISHKYLNHGKVVPAQKYFKVYNINCQRSYSTSPFNVNSAKLYKYVLGRKHSIETLLSLIASRGYYVNIHEKADSD